MVQPYIQYYIWLIGLVSIRTGQSTQEMGHWISTHSMQEANMEKKLLLNGLPLWSHKIRSLIFYERVNLAMLPNSFVLQLQLHYQSIPSALCMMGATSHTAHIPQQCLTITQGNITVKRPGNPTTGINPCHFFLCCFM